MSTSRATVDAHGNVVVTDLASPTTAQSPTSQDEHQAAPMAGFRPGKLQLISMPDGTSVVRQGAGAVQAGDVLPNDSILDSTTRNGFRIGRGDVRLTDVVRVPALGPVLVRDAVTHGYLKPVSGGFEEITPASAVEPQQQQQEEQAPEESVKLDDASEAFLRKAAQSLGRDTLVSITTAVINGQDTESYLRDVGRATGLDKAQTQAHILDVQAKLLAQGQQAAQSVGLDISEWDGFVEWSNQTAQKGKRQAAMLSLAEYGQTTAVKKLAAEYLKSAESASTRYNDTDVLNAAFADGISVRRASNGHLVVKIGDSEMLFSEAVRAGKVSVSRAKR